MIYISHIFIRAFFLPGVLKYRLIFKSLIRANFCEWYTVSLDLDKRSVVCGRLCQLSLGSPPPARGWARSLALAGSTAVLTAHCQMHR